MFRSAKAIALAIMASAAATGQSGSLAADADIGSATASAYADPFHSIPTASPEHLATLRGGFRVGGLDMEFAANVRTLVNGTLVLESTTSLTPGGSLATQSNMPTVGVNPQTLSFVSGQGSGQSTPLPASLSGLAGHTGVVVEDPTGLTTALHSVTREQILGVILTTASDQQIRQEINVEVTVSNFGQFQESVRSALFSGRLLGSLSHAN